MVHYGTVRIDTNGNTLQGSIATLRAKLLCHITGSSEYTVKTNYRMENGTHLIKSKLTWNNHDTAAHNFWAI